MSPKHPWGSLWEMWGWGSRCALLLGKATSQQALCKLLSKGNLGSLNTIIYRWDSTMLPLNLPGKARGGSSLTTPSKHPPPPITPCGEV